MTITNNSKSNITISNTNKRSDYTWNDDLGTWDEQTGTWDVPKIALNKTAKISLSISNESKP